MLTIVILAHDKAALTRDCLEALTRVRGDIEVVLVDNASTDDTPRVAAEFEGRLKRFVVRRSRRNLTFSVANNQAVHRVRGETLLFLNNDVIVSPGAPERLRAVVAESRGVAGPKLLFPGGRTIQHAGMRQMLWGYASNLGTAAPRATPELNRGGRIFAVTGAMLAIDRALFERIGGFEARFRWGYEDVDLCLKARAAGADVQYEPAAESIHAESATLGAVRAPRDLQRNYALYRQRWNHVLVPNERAAIAALRRQRIKRVAIFGTGLAARGLHRTLVRNGIEVAGFTASQTDIPRYCGRPVLPLEEIGPWKFDRMLVATQHYYALRARLTLFDPAGDPIFPIADGWRR